ncbi:hypothetical protein CC2G_003688 [Coprinopsis cinerea AmutBmut pab1-1]|nr:hypothetical protein CC2G_003688 [Coprinopsis cinerea AmutBmut pab1-1]
MATSSNTGHPSGPRVAVVTGAAKGLGRAIALRLAQDGFDVALNDIAACEGELKKVEEELGAYGRRSVRCVGDVSLERDVKRLVEDAVAVLGGVDVMVANAGICITKPFLDTTEEDWNRIFGINAR